jgi:hypothetical protein
MFYSTSYEALPSQNRAKQSHITAISFQIYPSTTYKFLCSSTLVTWHVPHYFLFLFFGGGGGQIWG